MDEQDRRDAGMKVRREVLGTSTARRQKRANSRPSSRT
jgi:hypothetical protein